MRGATNGCYLSNNGVIKCFGTEFNTSVPGLNDSMSVPATTGLRAEVYSDTTIELFWDAPRDAFNVAGFEIFRNGEVLTLTQNGSSYFIDDIDPGASTTFAVRRVSIEGATGPFSDDLIVLTGDSASNPGTGNSNYQPPARQHEPANLEALVYGANALELVWDRASTFAINGYEIRRDGVYIGFTNGTSFYDETPDSDRVYRYDVIPVNRDDASAFFGFSSVNASLGGADAALCF